MSARDLVMGAAGAGAPPITYVGGRVQTFSGTTSDVSISLTSLSGGVASSPSEGDLVLIFVGISTTSTQLTREITNFRRLVEGSRIDTVVAYLGCFSKFMGSTPDTSATLVGGTANIDAAGAVVVQVWRNVDSYVFIDDSKLLAENTNDTVKPNPPSITPATQGAVIVVAGCGAHTQGTQTFSSSDLDGFITGGANDTNDITIGAGYKSWSGGAFDPAQFTFSSGDNLAYSARSCTLALRPKILAAVGPPTLIATSKNQAATNVTSLVINKPSNTAQNDLMVAFVAATAGVTWTPPSGWTEVADLGSAPSIAVAYKVAGASEGADYTFTSSASTTMSGMIASFRNASYDSIGSFVTGSGSLEPTSPAASETYSTLLGFAARSAVFTLETTYLSPNLNLEDVLIDSDGTSPSWIFAVDNVVAGSPGDRRFNSGSSISSAAILMTIKGV